MIPELPSRRRFFGGATAATLGALLPRRVSALTGLTSGTDGATRQVSPEARLRELGIELPTPRAPVATFVPGVRGKVGRELTLEEGRDQARMVGLLVLATIRAHLGSLDRVARLVRTFGMVNATPDFDQQPQVINGFSDLMVDVFGEELGKGTRAAVGMGSLPGGMSVEVESFWQLRT